MSAFCRRLQAATPTAMTLLRNLGSRLRRTDENAADNARPSSASSGGYGAPPGAHKPARTLASFAHSHGHAGAGADAPDLFYEDRELGAAVRALEDVRGVLHDVAGAAENHKDVLLAASASQRALGEVLAGALEVGKKQGGGEDGYDDLDLGGGGGGEDSLGVVAGFLSEESCESQRCLAQSFVVNSSSITKLGIAFCNPIADLLSAFEERFARKIVPLRKRYVDQKGQYLKYMRQSDAAEEDEKRNYFDALAQAAKPIWVRTSKELKMEAHVMTQLTSRNLAKWSKGLALQHERGLAIAAANYADAFTRAKALSK